jgi:hypothetical protein
MHPDRAKIDENIIRGIVYSVISRKYDLSRDSIQRHAQNHIKGAIMAEEAKRAWDAASLIDECLEISLGSAKEARADRCYSAIGSIMNGPVKICELLTKTSDDNKADTGLMEMRLQLKMMRDKTSEETIE